jgi:hypothetical protein
MNNKQITVNSHRTFILLLLSQLVYGHSGGLDANGGHNDRKNGGYHCHRESCLKNSSNLGKPIVPYVPPRTSGAPDYNREEWPHWSDLDGDCMNTRHEMLLEQADGDVNLSPDGCYVSTGTWNGPFSGKTYHRASDLDVDHIIPLKWAHAHGGWRWSTDEKERFANDPRNLLVVDDGLNQAKGAQSPMTWLPPNESFRCEYLAQWLTVLIAYPDLKMPSSENKRFVSMLRECNQ